MIALNARESFRSTVSFLLFFVDDLLEFLFHLQLVGVFFDRWSQGSFPVEKVWPDDSSLFDFHLHYLVVDYVLERF